MSKYQWYKNTNWQVHTQRRVPWSFLGVPWIGYTCLICLAWDRERPLSGEIRRCEICLQLLDWNIFWCHHQSILPLCWRKSFNDWALEIDLSCLSGGRCPLWVGFTSALALVPVVRGECSWGRLACGRSSEDSVKRKRMASCFLESTG